MAIPKGEEGIPLFFQRQQLAGIIFIAVLTVKGCVLAHVILLSWY